MKGNEDETKKPGRNKKSEKRAATNGKPTESSEKIKYNAFPLINFYNSVDGYYDHQSA